MLSTVRLLSKRLKAPNKVPVRNGGGGKMLNKYIRVEENAGLREKGMETYEFNFNAFVQTMIFMVIPGYFIYEISMEERMIRDARNKRDYKYGTLFPSHITEDAAAE